MPGLESVDTKLALKATSTFHINPVDVFVFNALSCYSGISVSKIIVPVKKIRYEI